MMTNLQYAQHLARVMYESKYKCHAPNWQPFDDLAGVLTQIDNMLSGYIDDADKLKRIKAAMRVNEREFRSRTALRRK